VRTRYHSLDLVAHPEYFETIDRYPCDESYYIAPAREMLPDGWRIFRQGIWCYCDRPGTVIPAEGWKMHIAGTTHTAPELLRRLVPLFVEQGVSFKFAADRVLLSLMNGKRWNRGGSGKFMTVYPRDEAEFLRLLELAHERTADLAGPYILSDRRYAASKVVFYRYGTLLPQSALASNGARVSVLVGAGGELVEDRRNPAFFLPPWVTDPVPGAAPPPVQDGPVYLRDGRYKIDHPIAFSNSGGVYVAKDERTGRSVILKEARPRTNWTAQDVDATVLLAKEHRLLSKLGDTHFTPQAYEIFTEWEHTFVAQERIFGFTLHATGVAETPLIKIDGTPDIAKFLRTYRDIFRSLAAAIAAVHAHGVVFGDLSPSNILWCEDERKVMLLDLEGAIELGVDKPPRLTTLGFEAPGMTFGYEPSYDDDWYSFAALMLNFLLPVAEMTRLRGGSLGTIVARLGGEAGLPGDVVELLTSLLSEERDRKPRVDALLAALDRAADGPLAVCAPQPLVEPDRATVEALASYVVATADPSRTDRLFPSDFRLFGTNPLSVAYGAAGVLAELRRADTPVPEHLVDWLENAPIAQNAIPPGLSLGSAGIAWALLELGRHERARATLTAARAHPLITRSAGLALGAAGWGLANLRFFLEYGDAPFLAEAVAAGDHLLSAAVRDDDGLHWEQNGITPYGLHHGASGVASFLVYLARATERCDFLQASFDAMRFDLSRGETTRDGSMSWPYGTDFTNIWLPYLAYGSAGVGAALLRVLYLGGFEELRPWLDPIFADTDRKFSVTRGIYNGMAGIGSFQLDAYRFTGEERYVRAARNLADTIMMYALPRPEGLALPGDTLTRITCDFATGSAGVISFFDRLQRGGPAPYFLDEFFPVRDARSAAAQRPAVLA
jgi:tRNA A-37 threonylcarbamoyl transferase component Bud32